MENLKSQVEIEEASVPKDISSPPKMLPLKLFEENYQTISNLGNGSFGTVALAKYKKSKRSLLRTQERNVGTLLDPMEDAEPHLSCLVAIKTMKRSLETLQEYTRVKEVRFILMIPSHPCLVQIYDMFVDSKAFQLHIVMESMNQNLYQLMRARKRIKFSPTALKSILSQLLDAIRHIHKHDYFHRDVKPENILIMPTLQYYGCRENIPPHRRNDNYIVKLADYGLARHVGDLSRYTSYVSTRWYRSPEILLRRRWYSKPADIWAFGTIAVEIANFIPLFPGTSELDQIWRILEVLGSPVVPNFGHSIRRDTFCTPLGGYWKEAQVLASRLGFTIPYTDGVQIQNLIPDDITSELGDVIKACLTWNPDVRADVESLGTMPYFKNTSVSLPYKEPKRPSNTMKRGPLSDSKDELLICRNFNTNRYIKEKNTAKAIAYDNTAAQVTTEQPTQTNENDIYRKIDHLKNFKHAKTTNFSSLIGNNNFQIFDPSEDDLANNVMNKNENNSYNDYSGNTYKHSYNYSDKSKTNQCQFSTSQDMALRIITDSLVEEFPSLKSENVHERLCPKIDKNLPMAADYESDEIDLRQDLDVAYAWNDFSANVNDHAYITKQATHITDSSNKEGYLCVPNSLKVIKEPIDEEFGLIGDISFGSGHEIKC